MIIPAGDVNLEAMLWEPRHGPLRGAALLCHPHPLYGGTMNNRVIFRAAKGVNRAGLAALRFNFRGVGASSGAHDKGIGELRDVSAMLDWLEERYPDLPLALVGFSFGAWVGLQIGAHDPRVQALVGLGLPLNAYDFDFLIDNRKPARYIIGSDDEHCARDAMEALGRRLPPASEVVWVDGADHFFTQRIDQVPLLVAEFLRVQFSEAPV